MFLGGVIMGLTIDQQIDCIVLGISQEEYKKRIARLGRLWDEKFFLEDGIEILKDATDEEHKKRLEKKQKRLVKVKQMINDIQRSLSYKT